MGDQTVYIVFEQLYCAQCEWCRRSEDLDCIRIIGVYSEQWKTKCEANAMRASVREFVVDRNFVTSGESKG